MHSACRVGDVVDVPSHLVCLLCSDATRASAADALASASCGACDKGDGDDQLMLCEWVGTNENGRRVVCFNALHLTCSQRKKMPRAWYCATHEPSKS